MAEVQGGKLKKFVVKNFLVLGFVLGCVWALVWPEPGHLFYHAMVGSWKIVSTINMMIIFLIFGATLETQELKAAFKEWKALILGLVSILVLTSLTGFVFMEIPFKPQEFGLGLAIFACVPTSLSQSVSVVIQGYGNGALSLLFTVSTNILGIFISPMFVKLVLGSKLPDVSIDAVDLLVKLSVSIIIPLIVGKAVRELVPGAKAFCKKYKVPLYLFNNFQIIMIVWMTLSYSQHHLLQQKFYDIIIAIIAAIMQHFSFLVMNTLIAWVARLPDAERKSFIVSSSQKSLPTAAVLIAYLPPSVGEVGLVSIPCIVFYIMQLFIDSFIAKSWASKYEKALELQAKYKEQLQDLAEQNPDAPSLEKQTSIVDKASLVVDPVCAIDGSPTPLTVEPLCPVPLPRAAESDRALLLGSVVRSDAVTGTNAAGTPL